MQWPAWPEPEPLSLGPLLLPARDREKSLPALVFPGLPNGATHGLWFWVTPALTSAEQPRTGSPQPQTSVATPSWIAGKGGDSEPEGLLEMLRLPRQGECSHRGCRVWGSCRPPLACLNGGDCTAEMLGWGADQRRILEEYEFAGKCGITGSPWLQASVYQNRIPWVVPVQWLRRPCEGAYPRGGLGGRALGAKTPSLPVWFPQG